MKKLRYLLLLVLSFVFMFTLSIGTITVLAEGEGTSGSPVINAEDAAFSNLFSGNDYSIKKEEGLKISLNKVGAKATSKNYLSLGEQGEYFISSAEIDVTGIELSELFYVRIYVEDNNSDIIHFWYEKTNEVENVYVTFNNDNAKFVISDFSCTDTSVESTTKRILKINPFKIELVDNKVFVNSQEIGDSLNKYPYAKLEVYAKVVLDYYLESIYNKSGNLKANFKQGTSSFIFEAEYYYDENSSFFARENAIYGYDYNVEFVVYDFLSAVDKSLRYTKISELNGTPIAEPTEITATYFSTITFGSQGVYEVEMKVNVLEKDPTQTVLEDRLESIIKKTITVKKSSDENSIQYYSFAEKQAEYNEIYKEIKEDIGGEGSEVKINIGDNFYYPSLKKVIKSNYFDTTSLKYVLCYASKQNSEFITTESTYFEVGTIGKYRFFVLPTDDCGNGYLFDTNFKETYEIIEDSSGNLGWALKGTTEILIPIFSFEVYDNAAPEITVGKEDVAFIGKEYKITSLTVNGVNCDKEYKLYYMSDENYKAYQVSKNKKFSRESFKDSSGNYDTKAYNTELEALLEQGLLQEIPNKSTDSEEEVVSDAFDTANMTFVPKEGHYYLICTVVAENGMTSFAITDSISALTNPSSAEYESEAVKNFFINNKRSLVLLGISGLCVVGIVLLLTIKPKEKKHNSDEV